MRAIQNFTSQVNVCFRQALGLNDRFHFESVQSHISNVLNEFAFHLSEELRLVLCYKSLAGHRLLSLKPSLDLFLLLLMDTFRHDVVSLHEVQELPRDFFKCLLRQELWIVFELREGNKLNDVALHILFVLLRIKGLVVCIESVHRRKVSIPYSNNDDADGQS